MKKAFSSMVLVMVIVMSITTNVFARGCYDDSDYDCNQDYDYDYDEDVVDDYDNEYWDEEDIIDCYDNDSQECNFEEDDVENYEEYGDITVGRHDYGETVYMTAIVNVTVRTGPGTQYTPVDCIMAGQKVGIVGEGPGHDGGRIWYITEDGFYVIAGAFTSEDYSPEEEEAAAQKAAEDTYVVEYYDTLCVDANIRSGPSKSYPVIDGATKGSTIGICYEESGWYYTDRGGWIAAYLFDENSCVTDYCEQPCKETYSEENYYERNEYNNVVVVSISDQMVYVYKNGECIYSTSCVTGKSGYYDTPKGEYQIYEKSRDVVLEDKEETYSCPVNYWMPFYEGYGLHDASWRECFGGETYLHDGSHGCVNMDDEAAEFIYNNCSVGTKVIVE